VNVLVTGHHGSRTSSGEDFLKQIQPETAVISCGEGNRYGHPHQETLERLEAAHCQVRRTDREGRVSLHAPVTE
jgi:competence protein ComEC